MEAKTKAMIDLKINGEIYRTSHTFDSSMRDLTIGKIEDVIRENYGCILEKVEICGSYSTKKYHLTIAPPMHQLYCPKKAFTYELYGAYVTDIFVGTDKETDKHFKPGTKIFVAGGSVCYCIRD